VVNSLTVFQFGADGKIYNVAVFLKQPTCELAVSRSPIHLSRAQLMRTAAA
jgi:hypothetical protein